MVQKNIEIIEISELTKLDQKMKEVRKTYEHEQTEKIKKTFEKEKISKIKKQS